MSKVKCIPYGRQTIEEDDIEEVIRVLRSDWLTTGPEVARFEHALAERVGAQYVVAFSSGTAALHAAYYVAGLREGDELITSPITFAATANAARFLRADVVFADVEARTVNISPEKVREKITSRTKIIVPVDFAGHPAEIDELRNIASEFGLTLVQDASHSLGATYKGQPIGSLSDMTIFSFHPVKHITTGEGGAVATNNANYYQKLLTFRTHGIERNPKLLGEFHGPWYYEMQDLGYNYRITDIQCALGTSQLRKLDRFIKRRQEIAQLYDDLLSGVPSVMTPTVASHVTHAYHLYVIRVLRSTEERRRLFEYLRELGIGVQVHYLPVYWHPYYRSLGYDKGLCPEAERYYSHCMSLPIFPTLADEDVIRVVNAIRDYLGE